MKKTALLLLALLVITTIAFQTNPVSAVSCGFERYVDDECEVYLEYFPIVPFDTAHPTASEEFPMKFNVQQNDWWEPIAVHVWPHAFRVSVYFRDDTCGDIDYVSWKRWYPTSVSQNGWKVQWSLGGGYGPLSIGATISAPDSSITANYTKYPVDDETYMHLSHLTVDYHDNWAWFGSVHAYGAGSINVPNDASQPHEGHHVLIWVIFDLYWHVLSDPPTRRKTIGFCIGDDTPADTDCWLTVKKGKTDFDLEKPGGPGGGCPILSVFDGSEYVVEGLLDIHDPDGIDVVRNHTLTTTPQPVNNAYLLRLTEHPQTHSYIDQVELFATLEEGTTINLPLISAVHSEHGNVVAQLHKSDDVRTDTEANQTIDLKFAVPPNAEVADFVFQIEGHNIYFKE